MFPMATDTYFQVIRLSFCQIVMALRLFVCLFHLCLIDVSIFAVFPNVMNLLCELPCGGIQFGDPDLSSVGFETGLIYLGSLNPIPTQVAWRLGCKDGPYVYSLPYIYSRLQNNIFFLLYLKADSKHLGVFLFQKTFLSVWFRSPPIGDHYANLVVFRKVSSVDLEISQFAERMF